MQLMTRYDLQALLYECCSVLRETIDEEHLALLFGSTVIRTRSTISSQQYSSDIIMGLRYIPQMSSNLRTSLKEHALRHQNKHSDAHVQLRRASVTALNC